MLSTWEWCGSRSRVEAAITEAEAMRESGHDPEDGNCSCTWCDVDAAEEEALRREMASYRV